MRYRILPGDTVPSMPSGERKYDEECGNNARKVLAEWVKQQGGQQAAAKLLHVNQSTINRSLDTRSQPQLKVLIPLAEKLGWSLDQILGLSPPPAPPPVVRMSDSEVLRVAEKVAVHVSRRLTPKAMAAVRPPPALPPKRPRNEDE